MRPLQDLVRTGVAFDRIPCDRTGRMDPGSLLDEDEMVGARKTLSAAAMTYVAALAVSLAQLLRLLLLVGGRSRRD